MYQKVREGGRIMSQAAVVAVGIRESGEKRILGCGHWAQRDRGLLVGVQPAPDRPRAHRRATGDLRRSRGAAHRSGLPAGALALDLLDNTIERVNAELDRRAKVVGIFPNTASLLRFTTAVLQKQHDEWQDGRRHFSQQSMQLLLHPETTALLPIH
jgi:hypothetical protein